MALIISQLLKEIEKTKHSIIITLPSYIKWEDYEKELSQVKDYSKILNFKVHNFPKGINKGDKCYIIHQGNIKGWMEIVGFSEKEFNCDVTGKTWKGKFIERSGPFHYITEKLPMRGFQGFRYFDMDDYKNNEVNKMLY